MGFSPWNVIRYVGLIAVAIVEAMNEALLRLPRELQLPQSVTSGFWHFVPLAILIILGVANFAAFLISGRRTKLRLEILTPVDGSKVELVRTVRGAATKPGMPVQLFVYAGDKKWYPQPQATIDGRAWSAECHFGNPERGRGEHYQIVAMSSESPIRNPTENLPRRRVKSQIVNVIRSLD
jgi:hypothetical protein